MSEQPQQPPQAEEEAQEVEEEGPSLAELTVPPPPKDGRGKGRGIFLVKFKHQELHDSSGKKWVALTRAVCLFVMFGQLLRPCAAARELLRRCHCSNA